MLAQVCSRDRVSAIGRRANSLKQAAIGQAAIAVVTMRELLSITTEHLCDCLWRGGMAEMHRKLKLWTDEDLVDVLRHVFECLLAAS